MAQLPGFRVRQQLYRRVFFALDADLDGQLSLAELSGFGRFILGENWDAVTAAQLLEENEQQVNERNQCGYHFLANA